MLLRILGWRLGNNVVRMAFVAATRAVETMLRTERLHWKSSFQGPANCVASKYLSSFKVELSIVQIDQTL